MIQPIRKLMTLLMLLMCSIGVWADDGGLALKHNFGTKATVTFYAFPLVSRQDSEEKKVPTSSDINSFTANNKVTSITENCDYIVAHVVPADGYWTNAALLKASLIANESIVQPQQSLGPVNQGNTLQTRGTGIDGGIKVTLISLDEGRFDGAGWYYYEFPEEGTLLDDTYSPVYESLLLNGFVLPKFDLSKGTASTDGKTYTFTVEDVWTTTLTIDEGKTEFTYNGSAQGPTKITNTSIVVKNGSEEAVSFETVSDHVTSELGLSANLTEGKAVNVGSYALTLMSKEVEVTAQSANSRSATTSTVPTTGIFINKNDIEFKIKEATFTETEVTAEGYEGAYDAKSHTIKVTAPKSATVKYGTVEGTYNLTKAPDYINVSTNTVYYQVTMDNYNAFTGSETVKITAKELTATVTAENKEYDATTTATVSGTVATGIEDETLTISGLTGTFADANVGTGKTVTIDGGEISAGANTTASNYSVSIPKSTTANITPKEVGLTWSTPTTFTYNGSAQGVTATATGLITGDECTVTVSDGSKTNASTTPYTATATGLTNTNYKLPTTGLTQDFTIGPKTLTIAAENKSKVAGATDPTLTYTKDGLLDADANVITGGLKREEGEDVGTYAINQGDLAAGTNYTISFTGASFTIEAASFVDGDVTAGGYEGTYDGKAHGIEVKAEGATIKYGTKEGTYDQTALTYTNVGTYTVYYEVTKANYNPVTGSETVKITAKELTATVTAENKEYDAKTSATVSGTVATGIEGETLTISGLTGTFADANVGTGKTVTIDGGEISAGDNTIVSNYSVSFPKSTTADITAKALTITAKDLSVTYGTSIATGTTQVTLSPATLPGNDQLTGISLTPSTTDVTTSGTITPSKAEIKSGETDVTSNYNISYLSGKLTIIPADFAEGDVTSKAYEGTYDGEAHTITVTAPKSATVEYGTKKDSYGLKEAPSYTDAGEYTVYYKVSMPNTNPVTGSQTIKISKKTLTITANAQEKVAGEKDPDLTYTSDGLVEGDAITGALARAEGEGVGEYAITQGTLSAGDNYTITFTGAKLTIKEKTPDPILPIKASFKVVVAESEGGSVSVSKIEASPGTQINMKITPVTGYHLETITIKKSHGGEVQHDITFDAKGESWDYFLMPSDDVIITAVFEKDKAAQNIFIYKSYYGEVVANTFSADENEQVNLVAHPAYDNCVLDELVVINDEGKQLDLTTSYDSKEGNIYTFMMTGNWVQVYSTFRGINDVVDGARPFGLDNRFYQLSQKDQSILQTTAETKDVQIGLSLNANIFCQVADDGSLMMEQGEDVGLMIGGLKKGNWFRIDHDGEIALKNPDNIKEINDAFPPPAHILTRGEDTAIIKPGVAYEVVEDGNLELVLKGSAPLVLKSIIVEGPDPTAINRLQADDEAADIYDLSGRKVDPTSLRKGMYIRNGKKIIIK